MLSTATTVITPTAHLAFTVSSYVFALLLLGRGYRNTSGACQQWRNTWPQLKTAQLDLCCLLTSSFAALGVLRLPALITCAKASVELPSHPSFHQASAYEALHTIGDWLCVPFFAVLVVLPWRLPEFIRQREALHYEYGPVRTCLVRLAIRVIVDVFFFALAVPVFVTGYRVRGFVRAMKAAPSVDAQRTVCVNEFREFCRDLPYLLLGVLLTVAVYPIPHLYRAVFRTAPDAAAARWWTYLLFERLLFDICAVLLSPILLFTLYRVPSAYREWSDGRSLSLRVTAEMHRAVAEQWTMARAGDLSTALCSPAVAICKQAGLTLSELPIWFSTLVLFWRWGATRRQIRADSAATPTTIALIRASCTTQIGEALLDIPYSIPLILSLWRLPDLLFRLLTTSQPTDAAARTLVLDTFTKTCLDVPFIAALALVTVTLYRIPATYRRFKALRRSDDLRSSLVKSNLHLAVFDSARALPFELLAWLLCSVMLLTLWRAPTLVTLLKQSGDTWPECANIAYDQFAHWLVDALFVPLVLVVCLSPARLVSLVRFAHATISRDGWVGDPQRRLIRTAIFRQFCNTLLDLPAMLCASFILATLYRVRSCYRLWRRNSVVVPARAADANPQPWFKLSPLHHAVYETTAQICVDVPYLVCGALVTLLVVRAHHLWSRFFALDTAEERRSLAVSSLKLTWLDVLSFVCLVFVLCTVWRASRLVQALRRVRNLPSPESTASPWHVTCVYHAVSLLSPAELFAMICAPLSLWRMPFLYSSLRGIPTPAGVENPDNAATFMRDRAWRQQAYQHAFDTLLDIPATALLAVLLVTVYRVPSWRRLYNAKSRSVRRQDSLQQSAYFAATSEQAIQLAIDIPYILVSTIVWLCLLRVPSFWRALVRDGANSVSRRQAALGYAVYSALDLLSAVSLMVLTVTLWRAPLVWDDLHAVARVRETNSLLAAFQAPAAGPNARTWLPGHRIILGHMLYLLFPPELLCVCVLPIVAWRLPSLYRFLMTPGRTKSDHDRRVGACAYALLAVLDVLCVPLALITLLSGWRTRSLMRALRHAYAERSNLRHALHAERDHRGLRHEFIMHKAVLKQAALLVRDVPVIALALFGACVAVWRIPTMVRLLRSANEDEQERSFSELIKIPAEQAVRGALDVVCLLFLPFMLISWRSAAVRQQLSAAWLGGELLDNTLQQFLLMTVVGLLIDLPFVLISPLLLWRLPSVVKRLSPPKLVAPEAVYELESVHLRFPEEQTVTGNGTLDGHGLAIDVVARPRDGFVLSDKHDAVLCLESEEFWTAAKAASPAASVVSLARMMMPLSLTPHLLQREDFAGDQVRASIELGTGRGGSQKVSHTMLRGVIDKLVAQGDTGAPCRVEYRVPAEEGGTLRGLMFAFELRFSAMQRALGLMQPQSMAFEDGGIAACNAYQAEPSEALSANQLRFLVLQQLGLVVADIISLALCLVLVVLAPWRIVYTVKATVLGDITALHGNTLKTAKILAKRWVPDVLLLLLCVLLPWRLPRALSLLTSSDMDSERASRMHKKLFLGGLVDVLILFLLALIVVTVWRAPFLLYELCTSLDAPILPEFLLAPLSRIGLRYDPDAHRAAPPSFKKRKLAFGLLVIKHFVFLLCDGLQLAQLVFIVLTLIELPRFCSRSYAMARFGWRQYRERRREVALQRQRDEEERRFLANRQEREDGRRVRGLLDVMPHESLLFPYLDHEELSACAQVCQRWSAVAHEHRYWRELYQRRWGAPGAVLDSVARNYWMMYRVRHARESNAGRPIRLPTQDEIDWQSGYRLLIMSSCSRTLERWPHILLLPFKIGGILLLPVHIYVDLRYKWLPRHVNLPEIMENRILARGPMWFEGSATEFFDTAHRYFFLALVLVVLVVTSELALMLSLVNLVVLSVLTLGMPVWLWLAEVLSLPVGPLRDIVAGVAMPLFMAFQAFLLFLPFSGWTAYFPSTALGWALQLAVRPAEWLWGLAGLAVPQTPWLHEAITGVHSVAATYGSMVVAFATGHAHEEQALRGVGLVQDWLGLLTAPVEFLVGLVLKLVLGVHAWNIPVLSWVLSWVHWLLSTKVVLMLFWGAIFAQSWKPEFRRLLNRLLPHIDPFRVYRWPFVLLRAVASLLARWLRYAAQQLLRATRLLLRAYSQTLALPTSMCKKLGLLGDLLLIPISLVWMGWPLLWPYTTGVRLLYFPTGLLSLYFVVWGRRIINDSW